MNHQSIEVYQPASELTKYQQVFEIDGLDYVGEVVVGYAHDCLWLETKCVEVGEDLDLATRYEFDFPTLEIGYAAALAILDKLESKFPNVDWNSKIKRLRD